MTPKQTAARAHYWRLVVENLAPIVERHRVGDTLHVGPINRPRREPRPPVVCPHCGNRVGSPECRSARAPRTIPTPYHVALP